MRKILIAGAGILVAAGAFYALGPIPPFWVTSSIKASVAQYMNDPDSVRLDEVRYSSVDPNYVCGYLNAKNRFGAYVGRRAFAYAKDRDFTFIEDVDPSAAVIIDIYECNE